MELPRALRARRHGGSSRGRGEHGLSLLEVMVATSLVLGSLFATVSAMDSGVQAATAADRRVQATAIAERDVETLRSLPYERIGLAAGSPGFAPRFEGADAVAVAAPAFDPLAEVVANGTTFRIVRHVTWVDLARSGVDQIGAYKRLTVEVSWPGPDGGSVRIDSGVSPFFQAQPCERRWVDSESQKLSGVVNSYYPGVGAVSAGTDRVDVGKPSGVGEVIAGDVVLLIQMEGVDAGTYEYALATTSFVDGSLGVTGGGPSGGLIHGYGSGGRFQVVRVAHHGESVIAGTVSPLRWNGAVGGVVAIDATTQLSFFAGIDARDSGLDLARPTGFATAPSRLLPGGSGGVAGGGLVLLRAAQVAGPGVVDARGGGGGGTVVVLTESGGLESMSVDASGTSTAASGGAVLSTTPIGSVTTAGGDGTKGTIQSSVPSTGLDGVGMAAGCLPGVSTSVSSAAGEVSIAGGATTVQYRIDVRNRDGRPPATGVVVTDALPGGMQFLSSKVQLTGGATRGLDGNPSPGDTSPRWGTFTILGGSVVSIYLDVVVSLDTATGIATNVARASYATADGAGVAAGVDRTVTVSRSGCAVPWTDSGGSGLSGVVNTYYPMTASSPSGSTVVSVGATAGAVTPIAAGDLLLLLQSDVSSASKANYEYVVASSRVSNGEVHINGAGVGGGLIHSYSVAGSAGASATDRAQVIRVPTYGDVRLVGTVTAPQWNGSVGGVIALDVAGTLDLAGGVISADGLGGADTSGGTGLGAGGSASQPAGGGGGGGGGAGGPGFAASRRSGGAAGVARAVGVDRVAAGGAGGSSGGAKGGAGGGAVLLRAATVVGGGRISADGAPGAAGSRSFRGGGGGGAGGTVMVASAVGSSSSFVASARGGAGGAPWGRRGGAGGSGGGGVVWLPSISPSTVVTGGNAGSTGAPRPGNAKTGVAGTLASSAMPGVMLGVGCRPVITVDVVSWTPTLYRVDAQTARWTVTLSTLAGRPTVRGMAVSVRLPDGYTAGASAVALSGGASRTSTSDPSGGSTPTWATFDMPGGSTVSITFDAAVTTAVGRYDLAVVARGTGPDGGVAGGFSGAEGSADDVTVSDVLHPTVIADRVVDQVSGKGVVTSFALDAVDGSTWNAASFTTSPSASRFVDVVQGTGLFPPTVAPFPGAALRAQVAFSAGDASSKACIYAEVVRSSDGTVLATVGSALAPLGCADGTSVSSFDVAVTDPSSGPLPWAGATLDDLRLRIVGWRSSVGPVTFDRAGLVWSWAGVDVPLQTATVVDASSGAPSAVLTNRLSGPAAATSFDVGSSPLPTSFSGRYVDLHFPPVVPKDGVVASSTVSLRWRSLTRASVCWFAEVWAQGSLVGQIGDAVSPLCRSAARRAATDSFPLPKLTAAQARDLTIRVQLESPSGSVSTLRFEQASLAISWGRP